MARFLLGLAAPSRFPPSPLASSTEKISAAVFSIHGGPEVISFVEDFPKPIPRPGTDQLLIRVCGAGLNPVDFKMRRASIPQIAYPKPKICGSDVSGIVVEAPQGSRFKVGDEVIAMLPLLGTKYGGYAEYVCVDEHSVAKLPDSKPEGFDLVDYSTLPLVTCTVIQALRPVVRAMGGNTKGKRCLVQAASGGVGSLAVQYCANTLGMQVTGTCSAANADFVRSLGASQVLDYRTQRFEDELSDVDVIVDPLAYMYEERTFASESLLSRNGHYVHIASSAWEDDPSRRDPLGVGIPEAAPHRMLGGFLKKFRSMIPIGAGPSYHYVFVHPDGAALEEIAAAVARGEVRPVVCRRFPLQEAREAHIFLEQGHARGKVVLEVWDGREDA